MRERKKITAEQTSSSLHVLVRTYIRMNEATASCCLSGDCCCHIGAVVVLLYEPWSLRLSHLVFFSPLSLPSQQNNSPWREGTSSNKVDFCRCYVSQHSVVRPKNLASFFLLPPFSDPFHLSSHLTTIAGQKKSRTR